MLFLFSAFPKVWDTEILIKTRSLMYRVMVKLQKYLFALGTILYFYHQKL